MKHLLKLTVVLFACVFAFFSCKNASITKRHYNKGYYVSHSGKHHKAKSTKQAENAERLAAAQTVQSVSDKKTAEPELIASAETGKPMAVAKESRTEKAPAAKNLNSKPLSYAEKAGAHKNNIHVKPLPANLADAARDRDGLSLIWLLIVVIAIVYLLGILLGGFGMGGLIHILGVVLVVLLILWLLRII